MSDIKLGKLNLPRFIMNTAEKLADINEAGADGTKAKRLVREMQRVQKENLIKLKQPSVHMEKFNQALKKLNVI
ncbi:MAG: hypothetical protein HN509_13010 [Halobacteriovoraceae bacterium]|jgi:hypothetical protein|nr:hypothetical protein [Halobacteriovoraceae bacterium]MBT5093386.1 hypothetical protein [Halobacteriovoraceae bacterium]